MAKFFDENREGRETKSQIYARFKRGLDCHKSSLTRCAPECQVAKGSLKLPKLRAWVESSRPGPGELPKLCAAPSRLGPEELPKLCAAPSRLGRRNYQDRSQPEPQHAPTRASDPSGGLTTRASDPSGSPGILVNFDSKALVVSRGPPARCQSIFRDFAERKSTTKNVSQKCTKGKR